MNREIKFRAWDKTYKKMIGPATIFGAVEYWGSYPESEIDLMQFTDLKDTNGKDIYEGDILQFPSHAPSGYTPEMLRQTVEFTNGAFYPHDPGVGKESEVIGNIYENPELLKS